MPSASAGASKAKSKGKAAAPSASFSKSRAGTVLPDGNTTNSKLPASSRRAPLLQPRLSGQNATPGSSTKKQNLGSLHPRTDPLGALTHLLKLLAALPTRIGGCAYRLTPAEHALAVHLVGVLDPYVCHGARALGVGALPLSSESGASSAPRNVSVGVLNGLVNQPTEILDAIISHLDDRRDLRNAGLTCRRLAGVVFPRHYEYRVIRCKVSDIAVWHHLARNRALARNVRRVEVVDERSATTNTSERLLIPRGIVNSNTDLENTSSSASSSESDSLPMISALSPITARSSSRGGLPFSLGMHAKQEKLLAAALTRMTGLTHFRWASVHAPIQLLRAVWPALMRSATASGGRLKMVEVCDNLMFAPRRVDLDSESEESSEGSEDDASEDDADGENDSDSNEGDDSDSDGGQVSRRARAKKGRSPPALSMLSMETVRFRSTSHAYGAAKQPELSRIAAMLNQCGNLKDLDITYITPRSQGSMPAAAAAAALAALGTPTGALRSRPLADELLLYGRWTHLTTLTLVNLRCASPVAPSSFLSAHSALEVLHLDVTIQTPAGAGARSPLQLTPGALPRLREIRASKEVINTVLECPLDGHDTPSRRPLEVVKGFKLAGAYNSNLSAASATGSRSVSDAAFLENLKAHASSIRRVELAGWHDMEDVRRLAVCAPHMQHLDVGRRLGHNAHNSRPTGHVSGPGVGDRSGPATNMVEWAELLSTLPELTAMHGVRFFYEVSSIAIGGTLVVSNNTNANTTTSAGSGTSYSTHSSEPTATATTTPPAMATVTREIPANGNAGKPPAQMSMADRSRMRKNDEIAGVLAWKCRKLRRVDHWEENAGKVIVLTRDVAGAKDGEKDGKVRWEVRRIKYL